MNLMLALVAAGYFTLHAQNYGEAAEVVRLIQHMLKTFIARDKGFRPGKRRQRLNGERRMPARIR
ncbi:DUF2274 domain-containing protein [Methylobacillus caricis]|uniref:DUF2274 domain-containing protein n=1 Tax=Methylobacillus caricis TaxID=1971611 RepID=UPI001CFFF6AD|nr:DUF2274 domain-containing protein [Methylobacillus caricis]MCB5188507.1 DUF2274 domain-containing protein [Methylobacillus caricis]